MNLNTIIRHFISSNLIKNTHYFNRYVKFIRYYAEKYPNSTKSELGAYERHHILPVAVFPEFSKEFSNTILLPVKAHYIAHFLLYKSINHVSCVYAFNQMRRISVRLGKPKCRLYAAVRLDFAKRISENNSGRPMTDAHKKRISARTKGTNSYRNNTTGEIKRFAINKNPENWTPFQKGRVRTIESKQQLGDKIRGRILQYHPITKDVKFVREILFEYIKGVPPWFKTSRDKLTGYTWLYNENTGEVMRTNIEHGIPEGFVVGRKYHNKGFEKINNSEYAKVLDLKLKKYCLVDKSKLSTNRYIKHGSTVDKIAFIKYNEAVYYTYLDFMAAHPEFPSCTSRIRLTECKVPKPHFNQSKDRQLFCEKHQGKLFKDLGISLIPLKDFTFKEKR